MTRMSFFREALAKAIVQKRTKSKLPPRRFGPINLEDRVAPDSLADLYNLAALNGFYGEIFPPIAQISAPPATSEPIFSTNSPAIPENDDRDSTASDRNFASANGLAADDQFPRYPTTGFTADELDLNLGLVFELPTSFAGQTLEALPINVGGGGTESQSGSIAALPLNIPELATSGAAEATIDTSASAAMPSLLDTHTSSQSTSILADDIATASPSVASDDIASVRSAVGDASITLDAHGHKLAGVRGLTSTTSAPDDARLPYGLFSFNLTDVAPGSIATVDLKLPKGSNVDSYYKQNPQTKELSRFDFDGSTGAVIKGDKVTLYLQDGGRGDDDGLVNGKIVDPGGPGSTPPTSGSTSGTSVVEADTDWIYRNDSVTFSAYSTAATPPTYTLIQWDFNYNGTTFVPSGTTGDTADHAFASNGTFKVAAKLTSATATDIAWLTVAVHHLAPILTPPTLAPVVVGSSVLLPVTVASEANAQFIEWWSSYDYYDYQRETTITSLSPSYKFNVAGDYSFWVTVKDVDGEVGEIEFPVTVINDPPAGTVTYVGQTGNVGEVINEGNDATFTVWNLDAELDLTNLDGLSVFADWYGKNEFELVTQGQIANYEWAINSSGTSKSLSFKHFYDDASADPTTYNVAIRVEDDWGASTTGTAAVKVRNVAPTADIWAGIHIASVFSSGQEVWALPDTDTLQFWNVVEPSKADSNKLQYHWLLNGVALADSAEVEIPKAQFKPGNIFDVMAWVTDKDSASSQTYQFKVVVVTNAVANGPQITWQTGMIAYTLGSVAEDDASPYGFLPHMFGPYGTFLPAGMQEPAGYNRYSDVPVVKADIGENAPLDVQFQLDAGSQSYLASHPGTTPVYLFVEEIWDVEEFSIGTANHNLLTRNYYSRSTPTLSFPNGYAKDRQIVVSVVAQFRNSSWQVTHNSPAYEVWARTPKTQTIYDQTAGLLRALREMLNRLGSRAAPLFDKFMADQPAFVNTLLSGFEGAARDFLTNIRTYVSDEFFKWLKANQVNASGATGFTFDFTNATGDGVLSFLLDYAGLSWSHIQTTVLQELGEGNVAVITKLADEYFGAGNGTELDTSDPRTLLQFLNRLELSNLPTEIVTKVTDKIQQELERAIPQVVALFVPIPGVGQARAVLKGIGWVLDNQVALSAVFDKFLEGLDQIIAGNSGGFQTKLLDGMKLAGGAFISLLAAQFGLSKLPVELSKAVNYVPQTVDSKLRKLVRTFAADLSGGTAAGVFDGRLTPPRQPIPSFPFNSVNYILFPAKESKIDGTKIKLVTASNSQLVKVLVASDFSTLTAQSHLTSYWSKADALAKAAYLSKASTTPATEQRLTDLKVSQTAVAAAGELVIADIQAGLCTPLSGGCFTAGTKLWTPDGYRNVEDFKPGDLVFSRDEYRPSGSVEAKPVEKIFSRFTEVVHVHVGGQVIATTGEHPFYAFNKGWTAAQELATGDRILTAVGDWKSVEEVFATNELQVVYNLRVADWHTYFVGGESWGWSAWAHNAYGFLSGLKVMEIADKSFAKKNRSLTSAEKTSIKQQVWHEGYFGGYGDLTDLTHDFDRANSSQSAQAVLTKYFAKSCVVTERTKAENAINNLSRSATTPGGTNISNWTAYIHTTYGVDARGVSYDQYVANIPAGADLSVITHGHHIVFKKEGGDYSCEAKDFLLYSGIDPYFGKENLAYAPNQGHSPAALEFILGKLKTPAQKPKSKSEITTALSQMAFRYIVQDLPNMSHWSGNP